LASVNKAILVGNLGKDPELRYTPSGQAVTKFSMATTDRWTDKEGGKKEKTEWHNIVMWGRLAEISSQYLKKGSSVYVEGRIQTRSWDDKDGNKRYTTEIVGSQLQILDRRSEGGTTAVAPSAPAEEIAPANSLESVSGNNNQDDLPF